MSAAPPAPGRRPQAAKLGLKPGMRVSIDDAPAAWGLSDPPADLEMVGPGDDADVIISFFRAAEQLGARLPALAPRIRPAGAIWAAWPRRAGGHRSDVTDNTVREFALPLGLVDVMVAAIDDDWSGLRLVWRVALR